MCESKASGGPPVFLVGMMGVGKSTIGPALAERLGRAFLDTDQIIERDAGRTIAAIFETDGEAHFRALERLAIETAARDGGVIALGGGAMAQPGAADQLLELGEVVYLKASGPTLLERIGDPESRPLLAGLSRAEQRARIEALLAERRPDYERAQHHVDASIALEEVVERIVACLSDTIPGALEAPVQ